MEQTINNVLKKLTLPYVAILFFLVAFLVYGNSLSNGYVADDYVYFVNNPYSHVISIPTWFGPNDFNTLGQYRPLQPAYYSTLYSLFGTTPFMYRVLQILLHVACTTLLYVLFRKFLSSGSALFASLVFLIHPMQVESVPFIAQAITPLFFLFGIIPLLLTMRKNIGTKTLAAAFFFLLLSLLTKETGIIFFVSDKLLVRSIYPIIPRRLYL